MHGHRLPIWLIIPLGFAAACAAYGATVDTGRPAIVEAAKQNNKAELKALLAKKTDPNAADADGSTALLWTAYHDDVESAGALIRAGAKPNAATDLGVTPLWQASENGNSAMVKLLLGAGADPNLALLSGETPLMVASRSGYPDAAEQLLAKGANPNAHGTRGQTALMWAVSQKHPEVVKVLLAHHADLNLKSDVYNEVMAVPPHGYLPYNKSIPHGGETALMFAARVGDLESAKLLLAAGANAKDADAWGVSALTLSEHSGFSDLTLFLLDKGADPNAIPNGFSALDEAIMRRDERVIEALLDHGADANATLKTWTPTRRSSDDFNFEPQIVGASPLWLAARFDEVDAMRALMKHGADPKFVLHSDYVAEQGFGQAPRKETATVVTAALGFIRTNSWVPAPRAGAEAAALEAVKMCAEAGADLNLANTDGRTALDAAKSLKYQSVVDYLTEKGAKAGTGGAGNGGRGGRGRGAAAGSNTPPASRITAPESAEPK